MGIIQTPPYEGCHHTHGNNPFAFTLDIRHPLIIGDVGPDCIADTLIAGKSTLDNPVLLSNLSRLVLWKGSLNAGEIIVSVHDKKNQNSSAIPYPHA